MNILIAEDEKVSLHRLKHFLEGWGHRTIPTQNGLEALENFLSEQVDIVITDWMMPEMDGLELVRHIRGRGEGKPYVYVILLTAKGDKGDIVNALEGGVDDYIVKPFDPSELRARVNVGERMVRLERTLKKYSDGLEKIVRRQTGIIRRTQEETIIRLLTALESRDEETGGHVRRIALFSAILVKAAGWPQDRVYDLRLSAPMHDIGKIGIPDNILRKQGKLTETEFETIKTHTTIGAEILKDSNLPMLQMAHDIALSHHEKWDGTGYPAGFAGEEIPASARVVALADVYDALSNDRFYRKASTEEQVLDIMKKGRGTHFDPYFFDLFIDQLPKFRLIAAENP
ncbi:MAG: response regulator [Deltaproteobacteria bacterium]|nr:response regulator [Deltaproteobacteria bacterium]